MTATDGAGWPTWKLSVAADDPGDPGAPEPGAAAEPEGLTDATGNGAAVVDGAVDGAGLSDATAAEADGWAGAGAM